MSKLFRPGSIYCLRVNGQRGPRRGYIGKTRFRDYRRRVEQHLYGYWYGDEWNPPKYWAADVVDYYEIYHSEAVTDWGLSVREVFYIRVLLPLHNGTHNHGNPRRVIPPPKSQRHYPLPEEITAVERWPKRAPRRDRQGRLLPEKRILRRRDGALQLSGRAYGRKRIIKQEAS